MIRPSTSRGGRDCARFLSRPNVHAIGWRSQESLAGYYQAFDVTLIPYRLDHPFNRACNPTKIMDAMGSGRPIVATAIPECRLHAERFHVAEDADGFIAAVRRDPRRRVRRRPGGDAARLCPGQHLPRGRRADAGPDRGGRDSPSVRRAGDESRRRSRAAAGVDRWQVAAPGGKVVARSIRSRPFGRAGDAASAGEIPDHHDPRAPTMNSAIRAKLSVMMFLEYVIYGAWLPLLGIYIGNGLSEVHRRPAGLGLQRVRHRLDHRDVFRRPARGSLFRPGEVSGLQPLDRRHRDARAWCIRGHSGRSSG